MSIMDKIADFELELAMMVKDTEPAVAPLITAPAKVWLAVVGVVGVVLAVGTVSTMVGLY